MPLYAFACEHCGGHFEELQPVEAPAPHCPACGAGDPRRLLSSFVAGPARKPSTFSPAATRQDFVGRSHRHR